MDPRSFARKMRLTGAQLEENAHEVVRRTALLIDQAVVGKTPVKTGRARANWRVQIGSANPETLPTPASKEAGYASAIAEGQAVILAYKGEGEIHITNNLPYIHALNGGSSAQTMHEPFFVETAVMEAADVVRRVRGLTATLEMDFTPAVRAANRTATQRLSVLTEEENGGN